MAAADDAEGPRVPILTTFDLDEYAYAGLRAGASGFVLKDVPPAELVGAVRAGPAPGVANHAGHPALSAPTRREREVLAEIAAGRSNAEIAQRLVLAEATVKTHVGRILHKLDLRDRVHAVIFAYEIGFVR